MILCNTIRPQIKLNIIRNTRIIPTNNQTPRFPGTKISIIIVDNLTNPILTGTRQTQIRVPRPPLNSSTRKRSTQSHLQISRRRRSHRRLQLHGPPTAALRQRSKRIARRINPTQRNRRLRPHHNPPPRRQHRRRQQHNQPHPAQHPPRRNPAPQKPTHLQPPAESPAAPEAQPAGRRPEHADLRHISFILPPPPINQTSFDNQGAGGADTDAILTAADPAVGDHNRRRPRTEAARRPGPRRRPSRRILQPPAARTPPQPYPHIAPEHRGLLYTETRPGHLPPHPQPRRPMSRLTGTLITE